MALNERGRGHEASPLVEKWAIARFFYKEEPASHLRLTCVLPGRFIRTTRRTTRAMIMIGDIKGYQVQIGLPNGYCLVTQIAQNFLSRDFPGEFVDLDHDPPDTKFTVVSLENLQVAKEGFVAEKILSEPVRVSGVYHLLGENYAEEIAKPMDQLRQRLMSFEESLPDDVRQQIIRESRKFLDEVRKRSLVLNGGTMWISVTFELVKKEVYDEQNAAHKLMVEKLHQSAGPSKTLTCSACRLEISKNDDYAIMPCGDYCHKECIWTWPRHE